MPRIFGVLMLISTLLISCSASKLGWSADSNRETTRKNEAFDESFDPLTLNDDDIEVTPARQETAEQKNIVIPETEDAIEAGLMVVPGYRVQILATKDEAMAREKKRKAMLAFTEKVYLDFEAPYHKLRLGDFEDRKEAETFREQVARIGRRQDEPEWSNAWIVPSKVNVRKKNN